MAQANVLNNLAELYRAQGGYTEAEPLFKHSLKIDEKALGPDHPRLATTLNNLALLYADQGSYVAAQVLFKRSLAIREKALGPEHPHTQTTWEALRRHEQDFAQNQEEQGRKQEEEGEETIGQRLAKRRRASG